VSKKFLKKFKKYSAFIEATQSDRYDREMVRLSDISRYKDFFERASNATQRSTCRRSIGFQVTKELEAIEHRRLSMDASYR